MLKLEPVISIVGHRFRRPEVMELENSSRAISCKFRVVSGIKLARFRISICSAVSRFRFSGARLPGSVWTLPLLRWIRVFVGFDLG